MAKHKVDSPLRDLRRARTITQSDLARLVGVSQDVISRAETGRIRIPLGVQARIAAVLGCGINDVFPPVEAAKSA